MCIEADIFAGLKCVKTGPRRRTKEEAGRGDRGRKKRPAAQATEQSTLVEILFACAFWCGVEKTLKEVFLSRIARFVLIHVRI